MYIGDASKASGATVKAIRLYEKLGLLVDVERENTYRVYSAEDILLIKFIKLAQSVGFKLSELKEVIYPKEGELSWDKMRKELDKKVNEIDKEITRLKNNKVMLEIYNREIAICLKNNEDCVFPVIKSSKT